ncbi:hypothetical protein CHS0354_013124 [Potamilus streckersoni]|uniref:Methionyl-tRNA formyltransferase, mitochondrial n=1 Tax=Potamilus streckersoni TaxID=2493646 RepID=A0AAE0S6Q6_9BIVA|nr:hypothetical protein CHS0354_013124 [Potamilus streckersoni]
MQKPSVVFFGTPQIAADTLEYLINHEFRVKVVISQPDRPKGRGLHTEKTPVKLTAERYGISVYQPEKLRTADFTELLKSFNADFFAVIAYGRILSKDILQIPHQACLNIHYSLLPRYRGAAPVHFTLINGDTETGVTVIKMDEGMDTGDIVGVRRLPVSEEDRLASLGNKLTLPGAELLAEVMQNYVQITPVPQMHAAATYTGKITADMSHICWSDSANTHPNLFRALHPSPGIFFMYKERRIKITDLRTAPEHIGTHKGYGAGGQEAENYKYGQVISVGKDGILIACGEGVLSLLQLKPEGKNDMPAGDFANGYGIKPGDCLHENRTEENK